jgi:DNA-binding response OmpR family regulator
MATLECCTGRRDTMAKTVFIIDDDLGLQTVLSLALKDAGYNVVTASDGLDALDRVPVIRPDLILSDVMMPHVDGVQVFEALKERLRVDGVPIIMMTALSRKAWFSDLEAEGAVILQKPFEVDHLLAVISMLLDDI